MPEGYTGDPLATPRAPKRPTAEQLRKITDNYKEMRKKVDRAGQLTLEMLRHPDITPELAQETIALYVCVWNDLKRVHESCRKNIGPSGRAVLFHPWETPL